jgi:hypothetical protein
MYKRHLAVDEAANHDVVARPDASRHREDLAASRMRPPLAPDRLTGDRLRQRWNRSTRALQDDAVPTNERKRLA